MTASSQHQHCLDCAKVDPVAIDLNEVPLVNDQFALLAHEIRNPLSALNFALEAWPSSQEEPYLVEELLQIIRRQVSQLTRLCNDLLDSGKATQGPLSMCRSHVDLSKVLQSACEQIQPFVDQRMHTLTVDMGESPLVLFADESRLTQVFANLLHNSAKFTNRHGCLRLTLEQDHDVAVIRVHDNGCGLSAHQLNEIFCPSSETETRSKRVGNGLGIGLRLAKSIVELHHGTIGALSDGEGLGSTFVVRLPLALKPITDQINRPSITIGTDQMQRADFPVFRIIVVDDDRAIRFLMSHLLESLGQSVTVADGGDMAMETIVQNKPEVVFLDLQMHGMSGYDIAREIRKRRELDGTVLIALSGNSNSESRLHATHAGFDQYIEKPTSFAKLKQMLSDVSEIQSRNDNALRDI